MASQIYQDIMARVGAANRSFHEFVAIMEAFWKENTTVIRTEINEAKGERYFRLGAVPAMPTGARLAFSGVINNLRAALDHVAYQLVLNANGGASPGAWRHRPDADPLEGSEVRKCWQR